MPNSVAGVQARRLSGRIFSVIIGPMDAIACSQCHQMNPPGSTECSRCSEPLHAPMSTGVYQMGFGLGGGRYNIESVLGDGAMGSVYRAKDTRLDRDVALKVLHGELINHPTARSRMTREAKALARIEHANVVRILDVFDEGKCLVLVLELVTGGTLADGIPTLGMEGGQAASLMKQILAGLQAIHQAALIHRDIKPANVLIDAKGGLKLADLGVAHDSEQRGMTRMGAHIGTPEYMSPEQVRGIEVTAASDVYSCGIVLCELLTGGLPFGGESQFDVEVAHVQAEPDLTVLEDRAGPAFASVVRKALMKKPDERWSSAAAMASAIDDAMAGKSAVIPAPVAAKKNTSEPTSEPAAKADAPSPAAEASPKNPDESPVTAAKHSPQMGLYIAIGLVLLVVAGALMWAFADTDNRKSRRNRADRDWDDEEEKVVAVSDDDRAIKRFERLDPLDDLTDEQARQNEFAKQKAAADRATEQRAAEREAAQRKAAEKAAAEKAAAAEREAAQRGTHEVYDTSGDIRAPFLALKAGPAAGHRYAITHRMPDGTQLRVLSTGHGRKREWKRVQIVSGPHRGAIGYAHGRWIRRR